MKPMGADADGEEERRGRWEEQEYKSRRCMTLEDLPKGVEDSLDGAKS